MPQTVSNAVATRDAGPVKFMWSKRAHLATVLPKSVDVEAFLGTAAGALYASDQPGKNLTLWKCAQANPDSLFVALMECAVLGHLPGTEEYYLTPRMDHGRPKVLGIEGYRGVIERMYRSGAVSKVVVREVCEHDKFRYLEGTDDKPVHDFGAGATTGAAFFAAMGKRGEMVGGYAYAELLTGAVSRVVILTRDDVHAARDAGGYKPDDKFSPWNRMDGGEDHPEYRGRSMWWKTFAKRLEPWVPTSAEYRREALRASASAAAAANPAAPVMPIAAAAAPPDADIVDAELVDEPPAETPSQPVPEHDEAPVSPQAKPESVNAKLRGAVLGHFERLGFGADERDDRLAHLSVIVGHDLASTNDLTTVEAKACAALLARCKDREAFIQLLTSGDKPEGEPE